MRPPIEVRPLGTTGEQVTVLGLGGACLSQVSFNDGLATVRRALELGITYFDTSPMYAHGLSQAIYDEALSGRSENYVFATKLGHFASPARFRSPDALRTQLEENLRILRRDRVDVLQLHESDWHPWWSDKPSPERRLALDRAYEFAEAPAIRALRDAQSDGLCRFVGVTGNSTEELARVVDAAGVDLCLSAFNYHLLHRGARDTVLPAAARRGAAVVLGGVFQNGQMADLPDSWIEEPPDWLPPVARPALAPLHELLADSGLSFVELTLRYLVSDPTISTILVGAATPAEIEADVAAVQRGPLPPKLHQAVEDLV